MLMKTSDWEYAKVVIRHRIKRFNTVVMHLGKALPRYDLHTRNTAINVVKARFLASVIVILRHSVDKVCEYWLLK